MKPFGIFRSIPARKCSRLVGCCAAAGRRLSSAACNERPHELLTVSGQPGTYYQLDGATNVFSWNGMATLATGTASSLQYTDSAAPFLQTRFYRVQELVGTNFLTGDHLGTTNGDVVIQTLIHASFVLAWGRIIYVDPK